MSNAPSDLLAFRQTVMALTGLTGNDVGVAADPRHLAGGGYHCSCHDIRAIGKYPDGDYSTRQPRDRLGIGDANASAVDIGDNWPRGGRAAWIRFNNALVAAMRDGDPALAALRGINFTPDGTARKRYDTNNRAQGVINSNDTVDVHSHLEWWRNTIGSRQASFNRITQIMAAAIDGGAPFTPQASGDGDMDANQAKQLADCWYTLTTGPYGAEHTRWAGLMPAVQGLVSAAAADEARDNAALAAIQALSAALANAGGNVDAAPIIAAVNAQGDKATAAATALQQRVAELEAQVAATREAAVANLSDAEKATLDGAP